jgi:tape measure domain-containing protein
VADESKDIELRIRARDYSQKTLDQLVDTLNELSDAQSKQQDAAKRGEASAKELEASYQKLEKAARALIGQSNLTKVFETQSRALAEASTRAAAARKAQDEYTKSLAGVETVTKKQQIALDKLARSVVAAERAQQKAEDRVARTTAKLAEYGIAADQVGAAQARIAAAVTQANAALERQDRALDTIDADLKKVQQSAGQDTFEKQAADAAKLVRASEYVRWWTDALEAKEEVERRTSAAEAFRKELDGAADLRKAAEYVRWWTGALEEKEAVERRAADTAAFRKELDGAADLRKASEYVRFWTQALEAKESAEAKSAADASLLKEFRDLGVESERSAKSVGRAAHAIDELAVANSKAGDSVRQVVDPTSVLVKTLDGLESAVAGGVRAQAQFAAEMEKTGKSTVDVRAELQQLSRAQSGAASIATLADRFANTRSAAAGAAVELRQARNEVLQYARAVQAADAPNDQLVASLREAEARLAAAERRYQTFAAATAKLKGDLSAAGVNVRNLASEISRLQNVAQRATKTSNDLAAGVSRMNNESGKGKSAWQLLTSGQRTTLSLTQRLRGEVLALTTTYVGLYAAIEGVSSVLDAVQQRAASNARLSTAFGADQVGAQMEYARAQAERLGIALPQVAEQYAKISLAAQAAGLNLQETRFVFESFAEVGKVYNLTKDELDGVFKAIEQIFSKGSVQAEELRGQLGDRLTGAFYEFAKSVGATTAELGDWMKEGQVSSEMMLLFANQFRSKVAPQLADATGTAASEMARFETAIYDLKLAVADSGFLEEFTNAVRKLTEFMKSDDGKKLAEGLGEGLTALAKGFVFLLDNIDGVKTALKGFAAVYAATRILAFVGQVNELVVGFKALQAASPATAAALTRVGAAAAAGAAGFSFGSWLRDEFPAVRGAANGLIGIFDYMWTAINGARKVVLTEYVGGVKDMFTALYNIVVKIMKEIGEFVVEAARSFGLDEFADSLATKVTGLAEKKIVGFGERTKQLRQEIQEELGRIQGLIKDSFDVEYAEQARKNQKEQPAAAKQRVDKNAPSPSGLDPNREKELLDKIKTLRDAGDKEAKKAAEKAAKERAKLEEDVAKEIAKIDDSIAEQKAKTIEEKLALIEREYRDLFVKLDKLGGSEALSGLVKIDELIELRKAAERQKLIAEEREKSIEDVRKKEEEVNRLVEIRDAQIEAVNARQQAGLITELEARKQIAEIQNTAAPGIVAGAQAVRDMIASVKDPEVRAALELIAARMDQIAASAATIPDVLISQAQILEQWAEGLADVGLAAADAALETGSLSEGFKAAWQEFRKFASDFLRQIAKMILQQIILNALKSNPYTAGAASFLSSMTAGQNHLGGIVGAVNSRKVQVDPAVFANARRYHNGGMPGLASDEVPTILQTGEEVLSRNDPRNAMNGGGMSQRAQDIKIVNTFDAAAVVAEGLNSAEGVRTVLNIVRQNRGSM